MTRLFVGNVPENFSENTLRDAFSSYGEIINLDLKCKPGIEDDNKKKFAFVTISGSNFNVESCIKHFSNEDFNGNRLYVTRARESFLERLQREREQVQNQTPKENGPELIPHKNKSCAANHHNGHKRMLYNEDNVLDTKNIKKSKLKPSHTIDTLHTEHSSKHLNATHTNKQIKKLEETNNNVKLTEKDEKKLNSDLKRLESIKKKRQEFLEKKNIIKTGLISIDKQSNKKVIFSDTEEDNSVQNNSSLVNHSNAQGSNGTSLFDDGGSDDEINFDVKKQYEGKKGQKVLDLQSRYKSDKRFVLDERFIEESGSEREGDEGENQEVELNQADEKSTQLNILQDVLGVPIKAKTTDINNKNRTKLGMLRFDPTQPEHAKYLVQMPIEEVTKKSKKKKCKDSKDEETQPEIDPVDKVEVSKEQFYKISDSLKETMTQPSTFSLRSLFSKVDENHQESTTEDVNYIPLQPKSDSRVKNPLDPGEKNPFVYDSSESENEDDNIKQEKNKPATSETKIIWREKLFFSRSDLRLKDGLFFFGKSNQKEGQKERRELKSLMKKRIYNKERKNTMFQKKIGGKKKSVRRKHKRN